MRWVYNPVERRVLLFIGLSGADYVVAVEFNGAWRGFPNHNTGENLPPHTTARHAALAVLTWPRGKI